MNLIEMSLVASVLIVGIVLFRFAFIHRIPKKVMIILWGIVVLRLVFPTSIPLPFPQVTFFLMRAQPEYTEAEATVTTDLDRQETEEYGIAQETAFVVTVLEEKDSGKALAVVYFLGMAVMFLGSAYLYVRDGRFFRESLPMGDPERKYLILQTVPGEPERKCLEKVRFRISDRTATPVTCGVLKPAIVFPKGIFLKEEKEIGFCLLHELVHIRNHDNLRKLIVHAVLCIHWFNPFVWVMYILVNRDMELLCDETAVRKCKADRQDYALALLSLAERRAMGFRTALGFGKNAVKERILAVMSAGKTTTGSVAAAFFAVALAVITFLSSQVTVVAVGAETAAEYTVTADTVYITNIAEAQESDRNDAAVTRLYYADASETSAESDAVTDGEAEMVLAVASDTLLPDEMVELLLNLADEFRGTELQVEITPYDYQLYFKGIPVYFFADNQKQDGEGFSGRVFAREAGNGNGDIGVVTVRDENGEIVGLASLTEEESKEMAKAW